MAQTINFWVISLYLLTTAKGYISTEKPSAIFKINKPQDSSKELPLTLGLTLDTLTNLVALAEKAKKESPSFNEDLIKINQKILQNLYNFASSFAVKPGFGSTEPESVALDVLDKWFASIDAKNKTDPNWYWPHTTTKPITPADVSVLAMKLAKNLYSFAISEVKISFFGQVPVLNGISMPTLNRWTEVMKTKIEKDVNWWKA
jgi:hypothetical protein